MARDSKAYLLLHGNVVNFWYATLTPSNFSTSTAGARKVAEEAENNKHHKYDHLSRSFILFC